MRRKFIRRALRERERFRGRLETATVRENPFTFCTLQDAISKGLKILLASGYAARVPIKCPSLCRLHWPFVVKGEQTVEAGQLLEERYHSVAEMWFTSLCNIDAGNIDRILSMPTARFPHLLATQQPARRFSSLRRAMLHFARCSPVRKLAAFSVH